MTQLPQICSLFPYTTLFRSSEMIYHNGKVYVGFGNRFFQDNGIRGTGENGVLALDADSGDILWKFNTPGEDRKSTRLNSSHVAISYAVFCLKKKKITI